MNAKFANNGIVLNLFDNIRVICKVFLKRFFFLQT
jgi:hypothetical protein